MVNWIVALVVLVKVEMVALETSRVPLWHYYYNHCNYFYYQRVGDLNCIEMKAASWRRELAATKTSLRN